MATPPINHEILGPSEDPTHPIPNLDAIDLIAEGKSGDGMLLVVVAGGPLGADAKTQTRLAEKIGAYLHFIASPAFKAEFGDRAGRATIVVKAHHGCAPEIRTLLALCGKWAGDSGVSVILEIPET